MAREIKSVEDLLAILNRRRWDIIIPSLAIFAVAAVAAFSIPKKYRSSATILIEAQEVPTEYVKANISSYVDQRLQSLNQQIMGTPRLLEVISRFNLYADLKSRLTMDEIVEKMRKDIKFVSITGDVGDSRSGRSERGTIAFSVSYVGRNREVVQQVASALSSLYVAENLKGRDKQSAVTSKFLQDEMASLKATLSQIERKITAFKQKNIEALPELSQVNMQAFDQVDRDIRMLNDHLRTDREKQEYLQTQLANFPQNSSSDREALHQLRLRLADLEARFTDGYPDVKKVRAEVAELEEHIKAQGENPSSPPSDNPAYLTMASQLAATSSDIELTKRQIAALAQKRENYQRRILASPRVEEGYKAILLERSNLQQKYDDMAKKAMEANLAHGMEKEQLGERFTIIDPARLPEKPASPNIPAILLIGMILGIGCGAGLAAIKEVCDDTLRSAEELSALAGFTVLATIPEIQTGEDEVRRKRRRRLRSLAIAAVSATSVVVFHVFVMDLAVFWAKLGRVLAR